MQPSSMCLEGQTMPWLGPLAILPKCLFKKLWHLRAMLSSCKNLKWICSMIWFPYCFVGICGCVYIYTTSKLFCFVPCSTKMLTGPSKAGQSPPSNSDHGPPRSDEMPPCSTSLRAARWYFEQLMVRPTTNLERGPRVWKEGNLS